jgi:hypothetical protein
MGAKGDGPEGGEAARPDLSRLPAVGGATVDERGGAAAGRDARDRT